MANQPLPEQQFEHRLIIPKIIDWPVLIGITAMHVLSLAVFNPAYFSWSGFLLFLLFAWLTACVGITLTYHRLLTHRSFKCPKWFEYVLTFFGCLAWQGGPIQWVGTHRIHHKHSDKEKDPHSPKHGFTWGHMTWCMHKSVDGHVAADAAKDLHRDKVLRFMNKWFFVPQLLMIPIMYGLGYAYARWDGLEGAAVNNMGISWALWSTIFRVVFVYHGTWFVNSAAHTWGYRNYKTTDGSTNLWWVAIWSFGEGWHNNHHAYQRSAKHGLRKFELDPTYWIIKLLGAVGLATDIVVPKPEELPTAEYDIPLTKERNKKAAANQEVPNL